MLEATLQRDDGTMKVVAGSQEISLGEETLSQRPALRGYEGREIVLGIRPEDLEDAAIDFLEQTPLTSLDRDNILDAQGIRKITELTAVEHIATNDHQNNERKLIKKQDVEAAEAIFELERQEADAKAKQQREIQTLNEQLGCN